MLNQMPESKLGLATWTNPHQQSTPGLLFLPIILDENNTKTQITLLLHVNTNLNTHTKCRVDKIVLLVLVLSTALINSILTAVLPTTLDPTVMHHLTILAFWTFGWLYASYMKAQCVISQTESDCQRSWGGEMIHVTGLISNPVQSVTRQMHKGKLCLHTEHRSLAYRVYLCVYLSFLPIILNGKDPNTC